jgi:hypothetical protein
VEVVEWSEVTPVELLGVQARLREGTVDPVDQRIGRILLRDIHGVDHGYILADNAGRQSPPGSGTDIRDTLVGAGYSTRALACLADAP